MIETFLALNLDQLAMSLRRFACNSMMPCLGISQQGCEFPRLRNGDINETFGLISLAKTKNSLALMFCSSCPACFIFVSR